MAMRVPLHDVDDEDGASSLPRANRSRRQKQGKASGAELEPIAADAPAAPAGRRAPAWHACIMGVAAGSCCGGSWSFWSSLEKILEPLVASRPSVRHSAIL